jgi:serine/threonine-protein kinase
MCRDAYAQAQNLRDAHRLLAARAQLRVCTQPECSAFVVKECTGWLLDVESRIPGVVFTAKDARGNTLTDVTVLAADVPLTTRLDGRAVDVDPGSQVFTFVANDGSRATQTVVVAEGQKAQNVSATFGQGTSTPTPGVADAVKPAPSPEAPSPDVAPPGTAAPPPGSAHQLGTQRILAIVAGGLGVIGLGVGTGFGIEAIGKKGAAESACPGTCSTSTGVEDWSSAASAGTTSTVGFVLGGVAIAGAAVLWLTAPKAATATQLGLGPGSLHVQGSW